MGSFEGASVALVRRITKALSKPGREGNTALMGGGEPPLKPPVRPFAPDTREAP